MTAHAASAEEPTHAAGSGRDAPAGNSPHYAAAASLTVAAHGGGREARTPGSSPHRLGTAMGRACANGAIFGARSLLKPGKITVKAVCARRTTASGQDQVHVHHAKTTVIFHRFDPAPVGRMAGSGRYRSRSGRSVQQPRRTRLLAKRDGNSASTLDGEARTYFKAC